ncbi:MAG: hypothetical protein QG635_2510 [Bacteroidota bacterium]|nr:hypothetical protein [Bacteroidota bacterium]
MQRLFLIFGLFIAISINLFGQGQDPKQPASKPTEPPPMLKPQFVVEDIYFAVQMLNSIEIQGNEVDAFLSVKNYMQSMVKALATQKRKNEDVVTVEIPLPIAQNLMSLLQRAKISGVNAERYKRFQNSLVASANDIVKDKAKEQEKK